VSTARDVIVQALKNHGVLLWNNGDPESACGHRYDPHLPGGVGWDDQTAHRADAILAALREPADPHEHPCGDYPAPCNCDDPETHNGRDRG